VRQILTIKQMMARSLTIEQIQREFLFMRSDLEQLQQTLASIFRKLDDVMQQRRREGNAKMVAREIGDARALSKDLVARFAAIESRLTNETRLEHAAAS
jgi:division protein CdvB (Snf7/Vps24/ESCRT-III family)